MNGGVFALKACTVNFAGIPIKGFGDGDAIKIEPVEDWFKIEVGADGRVLRSSTGQEGNFKITITLMQGSSCNALLSAVCNLDIVSNGAGIAPFFLEDGSGNSTFASAETCIIRPADLELKSANVNRVWVFGCGDGKLFVGSN